MGTDAPGFFHLLHGGDALLLGEELPSLKRRSSFRFLAYAPDPNMECSKRSYEGQLRVWRRMIHGWDAEALRCDALGQNSPCRRLRKVARTARGIMGRPDVKAVPVMCHLVRGDDDVVHAAPFPYIPENKTPWGDREEPECLSPVNEDADNTVRNMEEGLLRLLRRARLTG
ncbi:MAG: hypothetical protein GY851_10160 [bacterium]|nr:hypothetical protein [bacterium]